MESTCAIAERSASNRMPTDKKKNLANRIKAIGLGLRQYSNVLFIVLLLNYSTKNGFCLLQIDAPGFKHLLLFGSFTGVSGKYFRSGIVLNTNNIKRLG
jgi:hypothetical protein